MIFAVLFNARVDIVNRQYRNTEVFPCEGQNSLVKIMNYPLMKLKRETKMIITKQKTRKYLELYSFDILKVYAGLTIKSEGKRAVATIVEYPIAIVESVKHSTAVRMHRLHRPRIRTETGIHGRGTRRT